MLNRIEIKYYKKPKISKSILVSGLPGIGNVGKIAADYLVETLGMEKIIDIFSQYFPPQVFIGDDSVVRLVRNSIYHKKIPRKFDLLVLVGDFQGTTQEGQYQLSGAILDIAKELRVNMIYTLGGYSTGKIVEAPRVLGAVTDEDIVEPLKKGGVVFPKGEPGGGIVGSAGVILGLAKEVYSIRGACLMGETSGYFADPKGAREVLRALCRILNIDVDMSEIEERSREIEQITEKMQEDIQNKVQQKEDLGYFG